MSVFVPSFLPPPVPLHRMSLALSSHFPGPTRPLFSLNTLPFFTILTSNDISHSLFLSGGRGVCQLHFTSHLAKIGEFTAQNFAAAAWRTLGLEVTLITTLLSFLNSSFTSTPSYRDCFLPSTSITSSPSPPSTRVPYHQAISYADHTSLIERLIKSSFKLTSSSTQKGHILSSNTSQNNNTIPKVCRVPLLSQTPRMIRATHGPTTALSMS